MKSALLLSVILLIPRWPVFGKADAKFVAGTADLVGKFEDVVN